MYFAPSLSQLKTAKIHNLNSSLRPSYIKSLCLLVQSSAKDNLIVQTPSNNLEAICSYLEVFLKLAKNPNFLLISTQNE